MIEYPSAAHDGPTDDPYRWLEGDGADVAQFVADQNALSAPVLAALPGRDKFFDAVSKLLKAPTRGCPGRRAGLYHAWHNDGTNQDVLVVADTVDGLESGRVLIDPNEFSDDGTVAVSVSSFNQDASLVAYAVADGGSDWWTLRVRDVASGDDLADQVPWCKWQRPIWLPDGRSFVYYAYDAPAGAALLDDAGAGRLMRHVVGRPNDEDEVLFERPDEPRLFVHHWPRDDDWFVLSTERAGATGNDLRVRPQSEPDEWRQLVESHDDEWRPIGIASDVLYCLTNSAAPRYRLVAIDLITGAQRELVAEHVSDVLLQAELHDTGIALVWSADAAHRLQLVGLDGAPGDDVALGEGISITGVDAASDCDEVYVSTTSFVDRGTRHVLRVAGSRLVEHRVLPTAGPEAPTASTRRIRATSADGTEVPAFVVSASDEPGPRPTLIWGYGGFNIAMNPEFRPMLAAWVAAGGVLCVPNLRGGGEFGADWHDAGTRERKQNVFDDLFAVAEKLIADGITTREQLALHGRSNGGLLAGAALTQRPELWAAVLPGVGVLDMLRYHQFTIGWAWMRDYGDPDDPDAAVYLRKYSPLHNVRPGTHYPPTLLSTGDHDDRVVPAHSYKFAAALQAAQAGDAPILLSVDTRAGHGAGKPKDARAREYADQLAFAAHHTGLD